jgi:hypothetical protein
MKTGRPDDLVADCLKPARRSALNVCGQSL